MKVKDILLFFFMSVIFSLSSFAAGNNEIIIPKGLKPGDTIGLVAPANYKGDNAMYEVEYLRNRGFNIVFGRSFDSKWYGFGGND